MSYIRTKDGIIDTNKLNLNKIIGNIKYEIIDNILFKTMYGYEAHLYEYEIISKADTIEELCDEFVEVRKGNHNICFGYGTAKSCNNDNNIIYGAIWTDKGLIYVAKMNKNGKLELI